MGLICFFNEPAGELHVILKSRKRPEGRR